MYKRCVYEHSRASAASMIHVAAGYGTARTGKVSSGATCIRCLMHTRGADADVGGMRDLLQCIPADLARIGGGVAQCSPSWKHNSLA
jgi:hypothetical protein